MKVKCDDDDDDDGHVLRSIVMVRVIGYLIPYTHIIFVETRVCLQD